MPKGRPEDLKLLAFRTSKFLAKGFLIYICVFASLASFDFSKRWVDHRVKQDQCNRVAIEYLDSQKTVSKILRERVNSQVKTLCEAASIEQTVIYTHLLLDRELSSLEYDFEQQSSKLESLINDIHDEIVPVGSVPLVPGRSPGFFDTTPEEIDEMLQNNL